MISNKMLIFIVMLILLEVNLVYADVRPNIVVSEFSIKEGSAYVGKGFTLSIKLSNTEQTACAKSITTSIEAGFPFIMEGISTFSIGDLCSRSTKVVDFPMKIDPTATGGFYQVKINNNYESASYIQFSSSNIINLFVNGTPKINANIVNSEPIDIYPGDTGTLTVKIENNGNFQAQSLNAVLKASKPIEVKWSKSFNSIEVLEPKQSKTIEFAVEVPKNAEAKTYSLDLELSYYDENNAKQTKIFDLSLYVKKKAKFDTTDADSDSFYANQNSKKVKIFLKNIGTDAARKVKAKILPQFPFSTDGSVRYIEMLDIGKNDTVSFNVDIDKDATPGRYVLNMLVDFEDAQGKKLQDTTQVVLVVKPKNIIRAVFLDYWFLWLIVAIIGFVFRRKFLNARK